MSKTEQLSQEEYLKRCQAAADDGNVVAQNTLGFLYLNGQGIEQNDEEAVTWFRRAAHDGYAAAQYNLAVMYKLGQGVEQSHPESIKWMQASANQSYVEAQSNLGNLYYQGLGVMQDYAMAYLWWTLAEQGGANNVEHKITDLANKMSAAQIREAKQLFVQWQTKH